jgi:Phage Tail Collar Domain
MKSTFFYTMVFVALGFRTVAQQNNANGAADLDIPNFIRVYSVDAIGGEQVETYRNNNRQYFYNPIILVDWSRFRSDLDRYKTDDEKKIVKILLKVFHYNKNVYDELTMLLQRDENVQNINLSYLPYSYYVLKARMGEDYLIVNPTDLPSFSNVGNFQTTHMVPKERNYELSGSLKHLREFYEMRGSNDNLKGSLYVGGFEFSSDYVKGTADFANSTTIKKRLFGDGTLIDNQVVKSTSSEGGLSLSLGPLKLGGGKVNSEVWSDNQKKRIVNRNYVSDLLTENRTEIRILSMGDADKVRETKSQIINYLLNTIATTVTLEFQKISDNEYSLVKDNVEYANFKGEQVDRLLKAKPQREFATATDRSLSGNGMSAAEKENITSKVGDDITWQFKGTEWVPTKADVYIISDNQLRSSISIDALSYNKEGRRTIEIPFIYPAAWLENRSSHEVGVIVDRDNPIGSILAFAGNIDKIPAGWKLCNGQNLPVHGNEEIFNVINYSWGRQENGDFNLPDLRGVFLRGVDNSRNVDIDRAGSASKGLIVNDIQADAFKRHSHNMRNFHGNGGQGGDELSLAGHLTEVKDRIWEGGSETRPINVAVNYIIRCK